MPRFRIRGIFHYELKTHHTFTKMKKLHQLSLLIMLLINGCTVYLHAQTVLIPNYRPFTNPSKFRIDSVIDARNEKSYLGLVIDRKSKSVDTLISQENYGTLLQKMFNSCVGTEQKQPTILKLNHLEFGKRQIEQKYRIWIFYDFEIYLKNPDGTLSTIFNGIDSIEGIPNYGEEEFNSDYLFSKLHWHFWNEFIPKITNSKIKNIIKKPQKLTLSEISKPLECLPIFCDSLLKVGSYLTKQDFIDNKTTIEEINVQKGNIQYTDSTDNSIRTLPSTYIYGYSDGKQLYINFNKTNQYVPVERLGTVFEASGLAEKFYTSENYIKNRAVLSGIQALTFPSRLNTGLAAVSAASLLINIIQDSTNYRLVFDTRGEGAPIQMPFVVLK